MIQGEDVILIFWPGVRIETNLQFGEELLAAVLKPTMEDPAA